jgi:DNA repair protein RadC
LTPSQIWQLAETVSAERLYRLGNANSPEAIGPMFATRIGLSEVEHFEVAWLDGQNQILSIESISHGTINQTAVYLRELVRAAIRSNAAGMIAAHNHPSGSLTESAADVRLTRSIKEALALIEVRLLDHIIVAGAKWRSLAQAGLI